MANGRHSYVRFFPSDWMAGTARLPRLHKSVYFDVCCYIWDTGKACPSVELVTMVSDIRNGKAIIEDLIGMGKLGRLEDGSITNAKAMVEAQWAFDQWEKRSFGGKGGRNTVADTDDKSDAKTHGKSDGKSKATLKPSDNQNQNQNHMIPSESKRGVKLAERPDEVEPEVWEDFQRLRKAKNAPLTETALKGIEREVAKASGWTLNAALIECCGRGWQGFKAEWVNNNGGGHGRSDKPSGWA